MRIVSLIVLIVVLLMFTGLSSYANVVPSENPVKSCCDECNKEAGKTSDHCSTPSCPMFLCLSVNAVSTFTLSELSGSIRISQFSEELSRESLPKPVFHPPVIA
jgi:hypothetical protein